MNSYAPILNSAAWPASSNVTLCNVPWNSDYRDIVKFSSDAARVNYLREQSGPTIQINQMVYAKFGQPVRLNIPFSQAQKFNYIRVFNTAQPIDGDDPQAFYYFILDVVYVAPETTHVYVQLDIWQTFGSGITFGNCYIERGHIGIANSRNFEDYGREFLTIPEGFDLGNEYQINKQYSQSVASAQKEMVGSSYILSYEVMVVTTVSFTEDAGDVDNPTFKTATGSKLSNLPNGAEIYIFDGNGGFENFLKAFQDKPWITQGIVSITAIPRGRYIIPTEIVNIPGMTGGWLARRSTGGVIKKKKTAMAPNWRSALNNTLPPRYGFLKKLTVYPYTVLELTSYSGNPLVLKPEVWNDDNATVIEVPHLAPPAQRLAFYPFRYNAGASSPVDEDENGVNNDGGEFLDMQTGITNFPTFSTLNNSYAGYLAANSNSIAYQHDSANWSQNRASAGNELARTQAGMNISAGQDLTSIGINAAQQQTALQNQTMAKSAMLGAGSSIVGGIAGGPAGVASGVASAALTGASTAILQNQNTQSTNISTGAARAGNDRSNQNAVGIADSNKGYADFATQGDYSNAIAGINARVQDAKMIQPTTSGQMGGDAFLLANYKWGYDLKVKTITGAAMVSVAEYWLRYGYAINRFGKMPESLMVMSNFTYWKLKETYITSASCPEPIKQAIRGIFEKGVTVWVNPNAIGNIDIGENTPRAGVTL